MPRSGLQAARDFDPYNPFVTREDLQRIRRQLAKVMNQRMVRLENTISPVSGEAYTFGSYDKMQEYLTKRGRVPIQGTDIRRFSEVLDPKMSVRELRKEIRILQGFEGHVSSQVKGMKQIERKRIATFAKKGIDVKVAGSKEFYDFLNSKTFEKMGSVFDSDQLVEEYNRTAGQGLPPEEILEAFNAYLQNSRKMSLKGLRRKLKATTLKYNKEHNKK